MLATTASATSSTTTTTRANNGGGTSRQPLQMKALEYLVNLTRSPDGQAVPPPNGTNSHLLYIFRFIL